MEELNILLEEGTMGLYMQTRDLSLYRLMYDGVRRNPDFDALLGEMPLNNPRSSTWREFFEQFGEEEQETEEEGERPHC